MSKEKYHIEFAMGKASLMSLWRMISRVEGLVEWFADEVTSNSDDTLFTFTWGKSSDQAERIQYKAEHLVRYRWTYEEDENIYFQFQLNSLELSKEIALQITDFAEPDEKADAIALWEAQIRRMKRRLGVL